MKNKYYIIGCGGFAKEVLFLSLECLNQNENEFHGFVDYKPSVDPIKCLNTDYPVVDEDTFLAEGGAVSVFLGIGDPRKSAKIIETYKVRANFNYPNLIHPNFVGHRNSIEMEEGNIVTAGCVFTVDISIGSFNIFNLNTTVGHDVVIGYYNVMNHGVNISGSVTVGNANLIGTNATILQEVSIGNGSVIRAASLANKPVADNTIVVGVPAKPLNR